MGFLTENPIMTRYELFGLARNFRATAQYVFFFVWCFYDNISKFSKSIDVTKP